MMARAGRACLHHLQACGLASAPLACLGNAPSPPPFPTLPAGAARPGASLPGARHLPAHRLPGRRHSRGEAAPLVQVSCCCGGHLGTGHRVTLAETGRVAEATAKARRAAQRSEVAQQHPRRLVLRGALGMDAGRWRIEQAEQEHMPNGSGRQQPAQGGRPYGVGGGARSGGRRAQRARHAGGDNPPRSTPRLHAGTLTGARWRSAA